MIHILTDRYVAWERISPVDDDSASLAPGRVEIDIGCGKGGFTRALAHRYPERLILAADVMLGRLRRLDRKVEREQLVNVRLLRVNAWDLAAHILPDNSVGRAHILCPDPWPKSRHRCKRLASSEFLGRLATKLAPGGILHLATDDVAYLDFMRTALNGLSCYEATPDAIDDIRDIKTDFERDFEQINRPVTHLALRRIAGVPNAHQ